MNWNIIKPVAPWGERQAHEGSQVSCILATQHFSV